MGTQERKLRSGVDCLGGGRRLEMERAVRIITIFVLLAGLVLSACGESTEERAATGGLIGGAAGLVVGAPIAGAAVGAGAGAVTDEDDF
jgi:osmotically inducible lipoprotein OsmB